MNREYPDDSSRVRGLYIASVFPSVSPLRPGCVDKSSLESGLTPKATAYDQISPIFFNYQPTSRSSSCVAAGQILIVPSPLLEASSLPSGENPRCRPSTRVGPRSLCLAPSTSVGSTTSSCRQKNQCTRSFHWAKTRSHQRPRHDLPSSPVLCRLPPRQLEPSRELAAPGECAAGVPCRTLTTI